MKIFDIREFGAVEGAGHDAGSAIAAAVAEASRHGGEVLIPSGTWHTGPVTLASGITFRLAEGSRLVFIPDEDLYVPVYSRWEGVSCWCMHPCLFISESHDVTVTGTGVIDGSGKSWWESARRKRALHMKPETPMEKKLAALNPGYADQPGGGGGRQCQFLRPPLLQILDSTRVTVEGVTLTGSPFWTLHPVFSSGLTFRDVKIINPADAPNTDGIDIDSCQDVMVTGCLVDVGDDGIALKSGSGPDGIAAGRPTRNVRVSGCTVRSAHGGIVIGSETAAGISGLVAEDCLFDGTDRGIRIKTRRGRGGAISDLRFERLTMRNNLCPLAINMYYRCGTTEGSLFSLSPEPIDDTTPSIGNILVRDCVATGSQASAGFIVGLPERPITELVVEDSSFGVMPESNVSTDESDMFLGLPHVDGRGIRLRNVQGDFRSVKVEGTVPIFVREEGIDVRFWNRKKT
ncbi:glycoside hydrolase family 28 protein [Parasphaerochaeta coccoides]|uniref:Polygalacturonase n=1 Tax=Parasphaerochaeta coccoides (strain ATCC BAA-1237 / DSM 17374 / SPN1) TaxID=760011 RepID=F4GIY6_PARC1|nr:glycoside hydrolase family 28 protein [Parasphaerochaeta coccoides]AEC01281.1 Polygalacturonase [Parasphaerochaeta coccoides DSM 17374]